MHPFQIVVVAVDFSDTSTDTIEAALELARGHQERIHLLNVAPDVLHTLGITEAPGIDWADVQRTAIAQARDQLVGLAATCKLDPRKVKIAIESGQAAAEIVRYADQNAASVIVLGSHGHGRVRRFVLGSVADRVLREATCPVMLVPHRTLRLTPFEVKAAAGIES